MDNELQKAREIIEDIRARCGQAILDEPMNTLAMEVRMAASKLLPIVNKALSQPTGKSPTQDAALREAGDKLNNAVWMFLKTPKEDGFDTFAYLQKASQEWEDAGGTAAWHYVEPNQRGTNYISSPQRTGKALGEKEIGRISRQRYGIPDNASNNWCHNNEDALDKNTGFIDCFRYLRDNDYLTASAGDEEPRLRTPVNPTPIDPKDIPDERKFPKDPS